ncbi:hypothetical protein SAMN05444266_108264 [Chitinophaga jiangningensis]|uniref:Uncharacterized protein n=1 Tax=Chitinophaga jiangningensis TaxID=1419482 RepID=A0A1M7J8C4_9BACT|nr:hypothetical protein SAMN05444266_108264 [Chitinophaga jiangningensis]
MAYGRLAACFKIESSHKSTLVINMKIDLIITKIVAKITFDRRLPGVSTPINNDIAYIIIVYPLTLPLHNTFSILV